MRARTMAGIGGAAATLAVGASILLGAGGVVDDGDTPLSGATRDRAVAAALAHTGGGTVTETAAGDDGAAYEVEVRRRDGTQVEVELDRDFAVVRAARDDDGPGDEDGQADDAGEAPAAAGLLRVASTGGLPQGGEPVTLDPADFSTTIDNPYWPMRPGSRWVYRESDTTGKRERAVVTVTKRTKRIANGVTARVVRDVVSRGGVVTEATDDYYAQDGAGNIWYLGEATTEYENGKPVSTEGSFEAGVDGAQAGIAIPARPVPGLSYRQEYYAGHAEDRGAVITVGEEQVEVPFGHFARRVLMTRDLVPLEPRVQELKFYAPGIGPVLSVHTDGTGGRSELIAFRR